MSQPEQESADSAEIAIVGMSGRFPGAESVEELWADLRAGRPGIRPVTDAELDAAGVDPAVRADPRYVRVAAPLPDIAGFDAPLFGFTPVEAATTDPHHRLFLECCWEALESAGYRPDRVPGRAGVFAGSGFTTYLVRNLMSRPDVVDGMHKLQLAAGNDRDALPTLVSYKLGLRGPSVAAQSFCSTSLVAVHLAVQSLLAYEADVALAGGASIDLPHPAGYLFADGGIVSPDGVVRSFDAAAAGTVVGNGVGVVVLKRLADAVRDGDHVHAVILGSAMNNDGRDKVGYSAPGAAGQAEVIEDALRVAAVDPRDVGYVECHATGTVLGDAVELSAMRAAFAAVEADVPAPEGAAPPATVLGSLKPTHGHLDRASGVSGLIRAALAVERDVLPGTPNFTTPNQALAAADGRFVVRTRDGSWPAGRPRYAGVSSFGLGGTNVHLVLGEPPAPPARPTGTGPHLLVLSARTEEALADATTRLRDHLVAHPDTDLADVAFTLGESRSGFPVRRFVVCADVADAVAALADPARRHDATTERRDPPVALHLTGPAPADLLSRLVAAGLRLVDVTGEVPPDAPAFVARDGAEALLVELDGARFPWQRVGELWLAGVEWDWAALSDGQRRRLSLPTYPFQREHHWVEPGTAARQAPPDADRARRTDPADWFYQPVWRCRPLFARPSVPRERGPWLVFGDDPVLRRAAEDLAAGGAQVVLARPGSAFAHVAGPVAEFTVRPDSSEDHERLLAELAEPPATVLHGFAVAPARPGTTGTAAFDAAQDLGFHAVRATVRALTARHVTRRVDLVLVSAGAVGVHGTDLTRPEHGSLTGLVPVVGQDHPHLTCRQVDLDPAWHAAAADLLAEATGGTGTVVAHRAGARWVRDHEPLPVPAQPSALLPPEPVVLITGGLGDVGTTIARHLAATRGARLVLTASSALDGPALTERGRRHARTVAALRADGVEVLALSADVGDPAGMAEVMRAAERRFGRVDLVVHGSGVSDPAYFGTVADLTRAQADAHFRAKVHGFLALAEVLGDRPDLPVITLSSLAAVLGGLGFAAYAGSNAALDAYAVRALHTGRGRWLTVDWEGWRVRVERHLAPGSTIADYPMSPAEALDVFDRSLALVGRVPHLVTSTGSLAARTAEWVANKSTVDVDSGQSIARQPRPALSTGYEPPAPGEEDDVARIWSEVLGVDRVGAHDDFFELGGHSLLATQLVGRLQRELAVSVPVLTVLRHPTVRSLTEELGEELAARAPARA